MTRARDRASGSGTFSGTVTGVVDPSHLNMPSAAPANPSIGDMYHDATNKKTYIHTGTGFNILKNFTLGSSSNLAASSANELFQENLPSGYYWIDKGLGAFECYVHMLKNTGWALVWNLTAHGTINSDYRGYDNPNFWANVGNYENVSAVNPYLTWHKSEAHDKYDSVSKIMVVAHDAGTPSFDNLNRVNEGSSFGDSFAIFDVNSSNNTKTIKQMMETENNVIANNPSSRGGGVIGIDHGADRLGGEPWIDSNRNLVFKVHQDGVLGGSDSQNNTWFGTTQSASDSEINHNGHVLYGGFGGFHNNGGYPLQYTAAPNLGYHPGSYGLGIAHANTSGGVNTVWDNNAQAANVQMVDFAIYVQ